MCRLFTLYINAAIVGIPYKTMTPLLSSLSNSSRIMFDNSGLNGLPCGVPSVRWLSTPPSIIPLRRYRLINFSVSLSDTLHINRLISLSWFTLSKNFSKSSSTTYTLPSFRKLCACSTGWRAFLFGRKPKLNVENRVRKIGLTIGWWPVAEACLSP